MTETAFRQQKIMQKFISELAPLVNIGDENSLYQALRKVMMKTWPLLL